MAADAELWHAVQCICDRVTGGRAVPCGTDGRVVRVLDCPMWTARAAMQLRALRPTALLGVETCASSLSGFALVVSERPRPRHAGLRVAAAMLLLFAMVAGSALLLQYDTPTTTTTTTTTTRTTTASAKASSSAEAKKPASAPTEAKPQPVATPPQPTVATPVDPLTASARALRASLAASAPACDASSTDAACVWTRWVGGTTSLPAMRASPPA